MFGALTRYQDLKRALILLGCCMLVCAVTALAGCTTTESDIPWNAPQSWEGSPYIPGLSGGEY